MTTLGDARQLVVDALSELPGVTPYPSKPDEPIAGAAWPRWALTNYTGAKLCSMGTHELDVYVLLGAGYEPATVDEGDQLLDAVVDALWFYGRVQQATPVQVVFDQQRAMPALQIRFIPKQ